MRLFSMTCCMRWLQLTWASARGDHGGSDGEAHAPAWSAAWSSNGVSSPGASSPASCSSCLASCHSPHRDLLSDSRGNFKSKHDVMDSITSARTFNNQIIKLFLTRDRDRWERWHFPRGTVWETFVVSCWSHVKISVDCFKLFWLILVIGGMYDQSPAHHQISHIIIHSPRPLCLLSS